MKFKRKIIANKIKLLVALALSIRRSNQLKPAKVLLIVIVTYIIPIKLPIMLKIVIKVTLLIRQ